MGAGSLHGQTNERLAALAASGDPGAFSVLYERHQGPLYRYCRSILHQHDDAQDAAQAAMTRALAALERRDPEASWSAWLFRIARNESIDQLRRRRPLEQLETAETLPAPGLQARVEHRERLSAAMRDMRDLPPRQRAALLMRGFAGSSDVEIGAALSLTPGAARQAVFEARKALEDYAAGRDLACSFVREAIGTGDGRRLRARRMRAHLRACAGCRSFRDAHTRSRSRRSGLAALVPVPLARLFGAWASAGGSATFETAGALGGAPLAAKALLTLTAAVAVGVSRPGLTPFSAPSATGSTPAHAHGAAPAPAPSAPPRAEVTWVVAPTWPALPTGRTWAPSLPVADVLITAPRAGEPAARHHREATPPPAPAAAPAPAAPPPSTAPVPHGAADPAPAPAPSDAALAQEAAETAAPAPRAQEPAKPEQAPPEAEQAQSDPMPPPQPAESDPAEQPATSAPSEPAPQTPPPDTAPPSPELPVASGEPAPVTAAEPVPAAPPAPAPTDSA